MRYSVRPNSVRKWSAFLQQIYLFLFVVYKQQIAGGVDKTDCLNKDHL